MKYMLTGIALLLCFSAFSQPNGKTVLMEHILSAGCPACAWGNYVRDSVLQDQPNVLFVSIHRNDAAHVDAMGCPDADSVLSEYLWAHPTAMVDRILWSDFPKVSVTLNQWDQKINLRKQAPAPITIGGTTAYNPGTRELTVTLDGVVRWDLERDIRVNAYIMEDSVQGHGLGYDQLNNNHNSPTSPLFGMGDPILNYTHRYVLRDMLAGHHGLEGVIPNPVSGGAAFSHTFTTTLDTAWNDQQVYVIVLVQRHDLDPQNREVYNAARIGLNSSVLAGNEDADPIPLSYQEFQLFPNPADGETTLHLARKDDWNIQLVDLRGSVLKRYPVNGDRLRIPTTELSPGYYLLRIMRSTGEPKVIPLFVR